MLNLFIISAYLHLLSVDKLEMFLSQFPDFPNAVFIGGPADFFVTEVADQVRNIPLYII